MSIVSICLSITLNVLYLQKKENQNPESEVLDDENDTENDNQDESILNRSHLHREVKNKSAVADVVHAFFESEDYTENKPKKNKKDTLFVPKKPQNVKKKIKKTTPIPLAEIPEPVAGPSKVIESVFEKSVLDILVENRVDTASKKQIKKVLKTVRSWLPESNTNPYRNEPKNSPFYPKNPCSNVEADFTINVDNFGDEYAPGVLDLKLNIYEKFLQDNFDNFDKIIANMKELQMCDEEYEALEENEKWRLRDIHVHDEITINLLEDSTKALYSKIEAIDYISEWCSKDNGMFWKEVKSRCSKKSLPSKRKND